MNKSQSILTILAICIVSLCFSSCSNDEENEEVVNNNVKVSFIYTLDTSNGNPMTRAAKTNAEVYDEFYQKIKTGELVAPSFELTLTELSSGAVYTFKGKWNSHDLLTLRTGTYRVVGKSTAEGDNIQEKCSFTFDEQIDINITSSVITLHAKYNSSLLIFNNEEIQTLQNYNGSALTSFFTFSTYKYAFVNNTLYDVAKKNEAYILGKYTDNAEFKIFTGYLNFEKAKYYVYNSISNGFDVPPMEEGCAMTEKDITTLVTDDFSQPIIVGGLINNYKEGIVIKKGVIVSKSNDDMFVTDNTQFEKPTILLPSNQFDNNIAMDVRYLDCSDINDEEFLCGLFYLQGNTDYYIRAFAITDDKKVIYGDVEKVHSQSYNRYEGRADYGNVWHAFDYTLFDLITDEIIDPYKGFYYSTNENPTRVRYQAGTGYNTCYKFATEWNYKLWYYHNVNCCDAIKIVSIPKMKYVNGKLEILKAEADKDKSVTIYYCIGGDGNRPENFTEKYTSPLTVEKGTTVYCYAISSDGYMSYTNSYKVF